MATNRAHFASKLGVIAATAGSAVGLGNIWRFPSEVAGNGGGAFVLIYLCCTLLIGAPIMISEFVIGRHSEANASTAFRKIAPGKPWWFIGLMGILAAFLIMGFYSVVGGWAVEYAWQAVINAFDGKSTIELQQNFELFSTSSYRPLIWIFLFVAFTALVVLAGIKEGIEKYSKILMPILFVLLLFLCIYSLTLPKAGEGLRFLFMPDFSKITSSVILSALGQSFFSLSLGMGCLITYGSYFNKKTNLPKTAVQVIIIDTLVAVLAAVAIFPSVFSFGITDAAGPTLAFISLPAIFNQMFGGYFLAVAFFFLLLVAAITSSISLLEVITAYVTETYKVSRRKATIVISLVIFILAVLSSLSLAKGELTFFGMKFFDILDGFSSKILLPLGGLFIAIFTGWVFNPTHLFQELEKGSQLSFALFRAYLFLVRYIAPLGILLVFLHQLGLFTWIESWVK